MVVNKGDKVDRCAVRNWMSLFLLGTIFFLPAAMYSENAPSRTGMKLH